MRELGRFKQAGREFYAALAAGEAIELPEGPWAATPATGERWALDDLVVLAPTKPELVVEAEVGPGEDGAAGCPRFRLRAPATLIPHRAMVPLPAGSHRFSAHPRIALVVGRTLHRAEPRDARAAILGWATAIAFRDDTLLEQDPGSAGALNHAGFAAIGPAVLLEPAAQFGNAQLWHNGRPLAPPDGPDFDPARVLAEASDWASFRPGDVVLLGAAATTEAIRPGDHLECRCPPLRPVALNIGLRGSA
jgi:2-keto-4-pentenoate hydratase/2-oxohepta-3-ene-1,7-dioic acid hydratase in catechol pathway